MDNDDSAREFLLQCLGTIAEEHPALVQEPNSMAAFGLVEIGSGGENGDALGEKRIENLPEIAARDRIDSVCRLIEQNHARRMNQRADKAEFLLHSARQVSRQTAAKLGEAGGGQQFGRPLLALLAADAEQVGIKADVFVDGQIFVKAEALRHVAQIALGAFGIAHEHRVRRPSPSRNPE